MITRKQFLESKVKNQSKDSEVTELGTKHIKITMVGALNIVEEVFGDLWGHKANAKSELEREFHTLFLELRKKILHLGNEQIRKFTERLEEQENDDVHG